MLRMEKGKAEVTLKRPSKSASRPPHRPKRPRLRPTLPPPGPSLAGGVLAPSAPQAARATKATDVFEAPAQAQAPSGKRIEFRLIEGALAPSGGDRGQPVRGQWLNQRFMVLNFNFRLRLRLWLVFGLELRLNLRV